MIKKIMEDIKLHRVSYLIEKIEKRDFNTKIEAFRKIEKMKITKNIGLFLIDASKRDYNVNDNNGGINSSLISLCFKNYYDEYSKAIDKVFKYLKPDAQNRVVFLLSSIDNESALKLYVDLILKYYNNSNFIPISNLFERPHLYNILFPKLFNALKFKNEKNNILILLNDYLNAGVVKNIDLTKNKKIITDAISRVFSLALKYKFTNTTKALKNSEYIDLRFFLEICINIECYISNKETEKLLEKLFKKGDNQLNLFILDNYIRKGKNIKKINLEKIAKDDASRYPLFEMLSNYGLEKLIPSKYLSKKLLAKSDFYINFMIYTRYKGELKNYKFIEKRNIMGYEYYIFKFKYTYLYENVSSDFLTNYVMHLSKIDKYNNILITRDYIGVSGGFNLDDNYSKISFNHNRLLFSKIKNNETISDVIKKIGIEDDIKLKNEKVETTLEEKVEKSKFSFSYILIGLFIIFILMLIGCVIYVYNPNIIKIKNNSDHISSELSKQYEFLEINGSDIFNKDDSEYYILFYKKGTSNKNKYYTYVNEYLKNNIKIYYVNMNDEKNKFLYSNNDFNFIIEKDRLLKVKDKEFEYYVDGKINILNEMKGFVESLNKEENIKK